MLSQETLNNISKRIEAAYGITYDEFSKLNHDDQQRLISNHRKKHNRTIDNMVTVMIGSGEHAIFTKVKKGERIMVGFGEHSCFVSAGITPEEASQELDDKLDEAIYSKPVAFVKKLQRRIKNK